MTAILLSQIRTDGGTQPRSTTYLKVVGEYGQAMIDGAKFPPMVVFDDDVDFWLADGFHRHGAYAALAEALGLEDIEVECDLREGSLRDAIIFSCGANVSHGMRRSTNDKRRAIKTLLENPLVALNDDGVPWADREIARMCSVDGKTVSKMRPQVPVTAEIRSERSFRSKHGTVGTMNTGGINADRPKQGDIEDMLPKPAAPVSNDPRTDFDWFADRLRTINNALADLPAPAVMVANYPVSLCGTLSLERALEIQRWWLEFTRLWAGRQPEFTRYRKRFTMVKESA